MGPSARAWPPPAHRESRVDVLGCWTKVLATISLAWYKQRPPWMFFITNGGWAKWTFSQLMLSISKGKAFGQREMKRRNYIGNLILAFISQNVSSIPFFKSKNLVPVLSRSLHYFFWHLKRKLFCVSVRKRFNVFIFLWCLLPLWVSITITSAALACSFVMWNPHIEGFFWVKLLF